MLQAARVQSTEIIEINYWTNQPFSRSHLPKSLASLPLPMLSHSEVSFPSVMTQGNETTFSKPQDYLFIISSLYSRFWHTFLPSLKFPPRKPAAISRGFTLSGTSNVLTPPAPWFLKTSEGAGESEPSSCWTQLLPAFLWFSTLPQS